MKFSQISNTQFLSLYSNLPTTHPLYSKKHKNQLFRWKIETKGEYDILEVIGLKAKVKWIIFLKITLIMYFYSFQMYSLLLQSSRFHPNSNFRDKKQYKEEKTLKVYTITKVLIKNSTYFYLF